MILTIFSFLVGCKATRVNAPIFEYKNALKTATPDFRKGWEDGCEVGMHSGSNTFYKPLYASNKQDGYKMASSSDYRIAWTRAYWFCYRRDYTRQKSKVFGSVFNGLK